MSNCEQNLASTDKALRVLPLALLVCCTSTAQADVPEGGNRQTLTGVFTSYVLDPCAQSFSFTENHEGGVIKRDQALANGAEIDFGTYVHNAFIVAVSNDTEGAIVDLLTVA